jgi:hypothetical protein
MHTKVKDLGIDTKNIRADLYIIRNGRIMPPYKIIKDRIAAIAERAIDILADAQGVGDIYRLYAITAAKGNGFKLAYVPDDEIPKKKEFFDQQVMRELFERGYQDAKSGRAWHSTPPGWEKVIVKREE